jgi:hypothetical protein
MAAIDNAAKVRTAILAAIEQQCFGEDYGVDVSMQLAQSPTGVMPVWALIFTTRSPLLGRGPLVHIATIPSVIPSGEQIEQAVTEGIKGLRDLSTKILTDGNAAPIHSR